MYWYYPIILAVCPVNWHYAQYTGSTTSILGIMPVCPVYCQYIQYTASVPSILPVFPVYCQCSLYTASVPSILPVCRVSTILLRPIDRLPLLTNSNQTNQPRSFLPGAGPEAPLLPSLPPYSGCGTPSCVRSPL